MAYCTLDDIKKYLDEESVIALSDDDKDGVPDAAVIDEVIAGADADIDMYLAGKYVIPLSPVVPVIVKISAKFAIHYLFLRRNEAEMPEKWDKDYDQTLALLESIARCDIKIGSAEASEKGGGGSLKWEREDGILTREGLEKF